MATVSPLQGRFDGGEVSPLVYGRVESERYKASLALCKDWIPTIQGGLTRRPASQYVGTVKNAGQKTRLIPFQFSTTQAYQLEFGDHYIRFWADYGQVTSSGSPYEITTPYVISDIPNIKFTQNADVLYLMHPSYPTMKLERFGPTNWQLVFQAFIDGPYATIVDVAPATTNVSGTSGAQSFAIGSILTVQGCASNGVGLIRVQVTDTTGLATGDQVWIAGVGGTTEANAEWIITVIDGTHFDLQGSTFTHAFTTGGTVTRSVFTSDIPPFSVQNVADNGAGLIRLQLLTTSGLTNGMTCFVTGTKATAANAFAWVIVVVDSTHVDLQGTTYASGSGASGTLTVCTGGLVAGNALSLITGAAASSGKIRLTVGSTAGLAAFSKLAVNGVVGTVEANGIWSFTVIDATHVDLTGSFFTNAYIRGGAISGAKNIGRPVRMETSGKWGWGVITSISNPGIANIQINGTLAGTAVSAFALGAYSPTLGFPTTASFHQDRFCLAGAPAFPQRVDGSSTSDYDNFAPTQIDGTVQANNSFSFNFNANDVNQIEWLNSDEKALLSGSVSAEWVTRPSTLSEAMNSANINAARSTKWGSASVAAILVGKATLFVQRGGRKLREMQYYFDIDGYRATDLTELAEHITGSGITDITYQSLPLSIVWALRNDGVLLGVTYDRDFSQLRVGWHQHVLGGRSDVAGSAPVIESISVIPSPDGTREDLWMIVQRYVNGSVVRYVEYLAKIFEDIDQPQNAKFLDCGNTLDNPITITGISNANPAVVVAPSHGLSTANTVRIDNLVGIMQTVNGALQSQLNGKTFTVTVINANSFSLDGIDTSASGAYVSGGQVRKLVSTISGITYLENETVSVFADGAYQGDQVVSNSGGITLATPAAVVTIGFPYNSDGQMLRLEAGSRNGTSLGKTRRTHRVGVMVHRSQGLLIGRDFSNLDPVQFRTQDVDLNGSGPGLISGIGSFEAEFDYDFDNQVCFRVAGPFPCLISAIMPQMQTQDRA